MNFHEVDTTKLSISCILQNNKTQVLVEKAFFEAAQKL